MKAEIKPEKRGFAIMVLGAMIATGLALTMWSMLLKIGVVGVIQ